MRDLLTDDALAAPASTALAVEVIDGRVRFDVAPEGAAVVGFVRYCPASRRTEPWIDGGIEGAIDVGLALEDPEPARGTAVYFDRAASRLTMEPAGEPVGCVVGSTVFKGGDGRIRRAANMKTIRVVVPEPKPERRAPAKE